MSRYKKPYIPPQVNYYFNSIFKEKGVTEGYVYLKNNPSTNLELLEKFYKEYKKVNKVPREGIKIDYKVIYPPKSSYISRQLITDIQSISPELRQAIDNQKNYCIQNPLESRKSSTISHLREYAPYCELLLKEELEKLRVKFVHQFPIGRSIVDFKFLGCPLIVELDGINFHNPEKDLRRDLKFVMEGYHVLRFSSRDVIFSSYHIARQIKSYIKSNFKVKNIERRSIIK